MNYIPRAADPTFIRSVKHLHSLGPCATAEALAEIAGKIGGFPAIVGVVNDYCRLSPALLRASGGDHSPARALHAVPAR